MSPEVEKQEKLENGEKQEKCEKPEMDEKVEKPVWGVYSREYSAIYGQIVHMDGILRPI